jgi:TRAP-type uncharacterized transport system substrate-binding protein
MHPKLASIIDQSIKIGSGYSGSFSMTRSFGRILSERVLKRPITMVVPGPNRLDWVAEGILDLCWVVPRITAKWAQQGTGPWKSKPLSNLRAIARFPQDDRQMIALAPYAKWESLEEIAKEKPPLRVAIRVNPEIVEGSEREWAYPVQSILRQYGITLTDIEKWRGRYWPCTTDFNSVDEEIKKQEVDLVIGEAATQPIWKNVAGHGFKFLPLSEKAMAGLEQEGFERAMTPAGFLPGIARPLLAVDESDFLLLTREEAEDEFVYAVTKVIDQNRKRLEEGAVTVQYSYNQPLPIPQMIVRSPLTGPITEQWKTGVPLHRGAERYYREMEYPL